MTIDYLNDNLDPNEPTDEEFAEIELELEDFRAKSTIRGAAELAAIWKDLLVHLFLPLADDSQLYCLDARTTPYVAGR